MYICLNRATAGGSLAFEQFVQLAAAAGFQGADVDLGWAAARSAGALSDLFQSRGLRFGWWGLPYDWRGSEALLDAGLRDLQEMIAIASKLRIDSCCTWVMPSSDLPLSENWRFHVARLKPAAACDIVGAEAKRVSSSGFDGDAVDDAFWALTLLGDACRATMWRLLQDTKEPAAVRGMALEVLAMMRDARVSGLLESDDKRDDLRAHRQRAKIIFHAKE